jgi:acetyl-CoA carboxylase biotin carboxyl carrier protein
MDLNAIFKLMDRAEESSFSRIEIQYQDLRLCLERGGGQAQPAGQIPLTATEQIQAAESDDTEVIRSPISGVFYVAKEPGAAPFVTEGSHICKGDTVCIIEAMKTMNEISAPRGGVITSVLVKDGQAVSANDPLFRIAGGK